MTKIELFLTENIKKRLDYISTLFFGVQDKNQAIIITRNKNIEFQIKESIYGKLDTSIEFFNIDRFRSFVFKIVSNNWFYLYEKQPKFLGFYETLLYLKEFSDLDKEQANLLVGEKIDKNFVTKIFERQQRLADNNIITLNDNKTKKYDDFIKKFSDYLKNREIPLLDYAEQLNVFNSLLENQAFFDKLVKSYKYWIIDGIEEAIPIEQKFYEKLWDNVNTITYLANPYGGLREFLGGNHYYLNNLKYNVSTVIEDNDIETYFYKNGHKLYELINSEEYNIFENNNDERFFELYDSKEYSEMLDNLELIVKKIKGIDNKAEISIIVNNIDDLLENEVYNIARDELYTFEPIRGAEVISKNQVVKSIINILRIIFDDEIKKVNNIPELKSLDYSQILFTLGNYDNFKLAQLRKNLKNDKNKWLNFIEEEIKKENNDKLRKLYYIITNSIENKGLLNNTSDYLELILNIWKKCFWANIDLVSENIKDVNILIKSCKSFIDTSKFFFKEEPIVHFIKDLLTGGLSDSPDVFLEYKEKNIKLITLQKYSESYYRTDYQIWLNVTSEKWIKKETHTVFNPYLFSLMTKGKSLGFDEEEKIRINEFSKKVKVALNLANNKIFFLSSDYDIMGERNDYELFKYFFLN
ncbi:MAG: hypothetical protein U0457_00425 [Candidatus Sericytochromatia bacterium]